MCAFCIDMGIGRQNDIENIVVLKQTITKITRNIFLLKKKNQLNVECEVVGKTN